MTRLAPRAVTLAIAFALAAAAAGCGYHALYGGREAPDSAKLHVALVRSVVTDAVASDEVVSAVREELAKEGALAAGEGYPRIEVEVLRVDETSDAIAAARGGSGIGAAGAAPGARTPAARGTEVGLVARAWLVTERGGERARDTGDVRALDLVATTDGSGPGGPGASAREAFFHADAVRAAARRVGARLARKVLGHPIATDESLGRER